MLEKIDNLHFDIKQLRFDIMDDLHIDCYDDDFPSFYDFMEAFDGRWSLEIIKMQNKFDNIILFHDLGDIKRQHYYEGDYSNPIRYMIGDKYTYIQNKDKEWLVCLNEKRIN